MATSETLYETVIGVLVELRCDLTDGLWSIFHIFGVGNAFEQFSNDLHNWRNAVNGMAFGNRRSITRLIGSALPLKPIQRPYLKFVVHRSISRSSSSTSQVSLETDDSYMTSTRRSFNLEGQTNFGSDDKLDSICMRPSLPFPDVILPQVADISTEAVLKIASLENELTRLRQQVSTMVIQMTTKPLTPPYTPVPILNDTSYLGTVIISSSVIPTLPGAIPPPPPPPGVIPPPPPPPPVASFGNKQSCGKSLSKMIQEGQSKINKHIEPICINSSKTGNLSMTEVLKGLNNVKLKRVDRSPGGTPLRIKRIPDPNDPGSIITAALKKRFAKMHMESPDKDSDASDFESPVGPLRKSRRDSFSPRHPKLAMKSSRDLRPALMNASTIPKMIEKQPPPFGQHLLRRRSFKPELIPEEEEECICTDLSVSLR